jgi:hypothetical protein
MARAYPRAHPITNSVLPQSFIAPSKIGSKPRPNWHDRERRWEHSTFVQRPRFSIQMEGGVLYFVAQANAHQPRSSLSWRAGFYIFVPLQMAKMCTWNMTNSTKSTTSRRYTGFLRVAASVHDYDSFSATIGASDLNRTLIRLKNPSLTKERWILKIKKFASLIRAYVFVAVVSYSS